MKIYFAPMEGLSNYIYRKAHYAFFNHIDKYYTPFIPTNESGSFKKRELEELSHENNRGMHLIPQLLSNNSRDFILMAGKIKEMGYDEINLNLGCPSGTVVAKCKGSGFLSIPDQLDRFLDEVYSWGGIRISLKTRIGIEDPEEFRRLMQIYEKYPVEELIIHPRVQKDFYRNSARREYYRHASENSKIRLCYNGDIFTPEDYRYFIREFPDAEAVMLGRGLLSDPGLARELAAGIKTGREELKGFHDMVYEGYKNILFGDINVLHKMKEIWVYMAAFFPDCGKQAKKIRKAASLRDYEEAVQSLFAER
jgi:tRNA-dihydrouridine synthase